MVIIVTGPAVLLLTGSISAFFQFFLLAGTVSFAGPPAEKHAAYHSSVHVSISFLKFFENSVYLRNAWCALPSVMRLAIQYNSFSLYSLTSSLMDFWFLFYAVVVFIQGAEAASIRLPICTDENYSKSTGLIPNLSDEKPPPPLPPSPIATNQPLVESHVKLEESSSQRRSERRKKKKIVSAF